MAKKSEKRKLKDKLDTTIKYKLKQRGFKIIG